MTWTYWAWHQPTERDKDILSVTWTYWAWHGSTERDMDLLYVTWTYWAWHGLNGRDMDLLSGTWTYWAFIAGTRNFISQETGNFFTDSRDPRKLYFLSKNQKRKGKAWDMCSEWALCCWHSSPDYLRFKPAFISSDRPDIIAWIAVSSSEGQVFIINYR